MKVEILSAAEDDLVDGYRFYERQVPVGRSCFNHGSLR